MSQLIDNLFVPAPLKEKSRAEPGEGVVNPRRITPRVGFPAGRTPANPDRGVLEESSFHKIISLERKRTERSRKPFLLMLLELGNRLPSEKNGKVLEQILSALSLTTRETDVTGWYTTPSVVGVMFTEINLDDRTLSLNALANRVSETLRSNLSAQQFSQIRITLHLFPEDWNHEMPGTQSNPTLYPDLANRDKDEKVHRGLKRLMDILGSLAALMLFSPLFVLIAILVKLTSHGPIIFQQERLGQFGGTFKFLKFRSMYADSNHKIHEEFMKSVISGDHDGNAEGECKPVYKMTSDPRITKIGKILRKTSLDELPQFINVLKGDMSLVGPRPPLAYEYREYDIWHRRRVLEVKPGITGLWQVKGRSRVSFDDMVRLDLQYVRGWSLWLDIRILMRTPGAVLLGDDAF